MSYFLLVLGGGWRARGPAEAGGDTEWVREGHLSL